MDRFEKVFNEYHQKGEETVRRRAEEAVDNGKQRIVAVRKNDDGDLIAFKLSNGEELDYVEALNQAKAGEIADVDVFTKFGREILRSEPDGLRDNNLDMLEEF